MLPNLAVGVVGHRRREQQAHRLARALDARLDLDDGHLGEWSNHRRSWLRTITYGRRWSLVVQDDAIPVPMFLDHATDALNQLPAAGVVVSFYLGTGYPIQWQQPIRRTLDRARTAGASWVRSDVLLHGVAVAIPTALVVDMIRHADRLELPYDERVGAWASATGRPVFYSVPSLVDHADGPTLVDHPDGRPRTAPRRAWSVGVPVMWSRRSVKLR